MAVARLRIICLVLIMLSSALSINEISPYINYVLCVVSDLLVKTKGTVYNQNITFGIILLIIIFF